MPLVRLVTNAELRDTTARDEVLKALTIRTAELLGKPEAYVMVTLEQASMLMAGEPGPAAYLDVRALGELSPAATAGLTEALTGVVELALGLDPSRVFLNFTGVERHMWGHRGRTFA